MANPSMTPRVLFTACLAAVLTGCIAVPVPVSHTAGPEPGSRANIGDVAPPTLVPGQTTRVQVLMSLGEPDGRAVNDSWFTYESIENRGGVEWAVVGVEGIHGKGGATPVGKMRDISRRLIVSFTANGIASNVQLQRSECDFWGGTSDYGITQVPGDCPDPRGSSLAGLDAKAGVLPSVGTNASRYDGYRLVESNPPGCKFGALTAQVHGGGAFIVGEHAIFWRDGLTFAWATLPLENIAEVRPLEKHLFKRWIPIKSRDGSCMFVSVMERGSVDNPPEAFEEQARAAILTRIGALKSTPAAPSKVGDR